VVASIRRVKRGRVRDVDGLALRPHPAGDALPEAQANLGDLREGRRARHELAGGVVDQVDGRPIRVELLLEVVDDLRKDLVEVDLLVAEQARQGA
jgi:hypothetical protein